MRRYSIAIVAPAFACVSIYLLGFEAEVVRDFSECHGWTNERTLVAGVRIPEPLPQVWAAAAVFATFAGVHALWSLLRESRSA